MATIDYIRNNLLRKEKELNKLTQDLAKEQSKIADQEKKILLANKRMSQTKSLSTIKSKQKEIDLAMRKKSDSLKKCGDLQGKISKKRSEILSSQVKYENEIAKEEKKKLELENKRAREIEKKNKDLQIMLKEQSVNQNIIMQEIENLKHVPDEITVLFLASSPIDTNPLRLDEEARMIQSKIRMSEYRDSVKFETRWATRSSDILQAVNETNPTIVHFSGHGSCNGDIVLLNVDGTANFVTKEAMTITLSTMSDRIELVVFNMCFSEAQAKNCVQYINAAIGMSDSIGDSAACEFAAQLYSSIGFGHSLQKAYSQAVAQLMLLDANQANIPKLFVKEGIDSKQMFFVN